MNRARALLLRLLKLTPEPLVWRFARTYIAGETLEDGLAATRALNAEGCRATLDVLGEDVSTLEEVGGYADEYLRAVEALAENRLDANISIKPTAMGLRLSQDHAVERVVEIATCAARHGMTVRLDMEDSSVTQSTIDLYRRVRQRGHGNVGLVLQSYLRRTIEDARQLAAEAASVRVCKGIYVEPREIAYQDYDIVRQSFLDACEQLMRAEGTFTAIATHDEWLVYGTRRLISALDLDGSRYEYQMLYGVDPQLRRMIVSEGHPLRVYVPFGKGWFPYSIRRLVENPRLAAHVARNVLGFGPGSGPVQSRASGTR
jgi:proline dehydrogenase